MIKTTTGNTHTYTCVFPRLMKNTRSGSVLLMTSRKSGMIVHQGDGVVQSVGTYRKDWITDNLIPYTGPVTLENI